MPRARRHPLKRRSDASARRLDKAFRPHPWYVATGYGETEAGQRVIFVYVKSDDHDELKPLRGGWEGWPVLVTVCGEINAT